MTKKFICKSHNLITTRRGLRKHLGDSHKRNEYFKTGEIDEKGGYWYREEVDED